MKMEQREKEIRVLRKKGNTLQAIGTKYGITRERVRQILLKKETVVKEEVFCVCGKKVWKKARIFCKKHSLRILASSGGRDHSRDIVRIRDGDKCQICFRLWKEGERKFDVHHLNGMCGKNSLGYDSTKDITGLITLCHKCHLSLESNRQKMKEGLSKQSHHVKKMTPKEFTEAVKRISKGDSIKKVSRDLQLTYSSLQRNLNKTAQ